MKKLISIALTAMMLMSLAACSHSESSPVEKQLKVETESSNETEVMMTEDASVEENVNEGSGKEVLVVYFSATGTTKGIAEKIAAAVDAEIYEINAAQAYTDEDLDYNDPDSRTSVEQNDDTARPEIGSDTISLEGYDTVFIGFPIWWGREPRIMDTFVESYRFDGITMIPFCTSGSSSIGSSGYNLAECAGSGSWLEGRRFDADASEEEIEEWIRGLK